MSHQKLPKIAQSTNCLVVSVASLPFAEQPVRMQLAKDAMEELDKNSHVCIRISLETLSMAGETESIGMAIRSRLDRRVGRGSCVDSRKSRENQS